MPRNQIKDSNTHFLQCSALIFLQLRLMENCRYNFLNLVARARDPLWEESWGSGKKPKRMHGIHCIPLLSDPAH